MPGKSTKKQPVTGHHPELYNTATQYYRGVPLTLIVYTEQHFAACRAKRFMLGDPSKNQNIWIPNAYLQADGTIQPWADLDWAMRKAWSQNKFKYAGLEHINPMHWPYLPRRTPAQTERSEHA